MNTEKILMDSTPTGDSQPDAWDVICAVVMRALAVFGAFSLCVAAGIFYGKFAA